jgi:hypothetical protein
MDRIRRTAVLAATGVVGVNIWTGAPLLALWVGSRVQGAATGSAPSMLAVGVVALVLAVTGFFLIKVLNVLQEKYARLQGRPLRRHRSSWLRSMRAERGEWERQHDPDARISGFDVVVILCVVAAVLAFEIWFFFYSPSPIDQRSGRS